MAEQRQDRRVRRSKAQLRQALIQLLQDTCRQQGMTVVVITHNSAIAPMADQVIHVKNGRVERIDHNDRPVPVETIEW